MRHKTLSEELREDIRYAIAWMQKEYRDISEPLEPELVIRLVVNAVRAINMSYTDAVVLAELDKLALELVPMFDTLTDGAFSSTIPERKDKL